LPVAAISHEAYRTPSFLNGSDTLASEADYRVSLGAQRSPSDSREPGAKTRYVDQIRVSL